MSSIQCYDTFGKVKEHLAVKTCAIYLEDSLRESLAMELLSSSQGNHSPGTVKFRHFHTFPWLFTALISTMHYALQAYTFDNVQYIPPSSRACWGKPSHRLPGYSWVSLGECRCAYETRVFLERLAAFEHRSRQMQPAVHLHSTSTHTDLQQKSMAI